MDTRGGANNFWLCRIRLRGIQQAASRSSAETMGRQLIADWRKPYPATAANLEGH